ncbi:UNVERIFIED_CONTAM: hypothetical protein Sradi_3259300 [Sesamum radiatum]|uniref:DUF4283 domain-containing protein n=1 Tax=Sesamum radiatum TaxID=300843 RepID=A0AAW2R1C2_SESRA
MSFMGSLSRRVVDSGDTASWDALHELKRRWIEKFGDGNFTPPVGRGGLKSVASRTPRPFPTLPLVPHRAHRPIVPETLILPRVSLQQEETPAPSPNVIGGMFHNPTAPTLAVDDQNNAKDAQPVRPPPGILIGNIPLRPQASCFNSGSKFSTAFNNSSRKTLSYIDPTIQNGEIIVHPTMDMVRVGSRHWACTAVGYFLGRKSYFHHLNEYVRSVWSGIKMVTATTNGFYFFQFKTEAAMEEVIDGGPWLFQGQPIVLQRWEPGMILRKHKHTQVSVWIKLRHLPVEFWNSEGISTVASGVGRPLYPDAITRACTRLDFARACVMLHISSKLPKHHILMMPKDDGSEVPCKVDVEYKWVPPKCKQCLSLGHTASACPEKKQTVKPPISIFVQKRSNKQDPNPSNEAAVIPPTEENVQSSTQTLTDNSGEPPCKPIDKGKVLVVYNPFNALMLADDDTDSSEWGPKQSNPYSIDRC